MKGADVNQQIISRRKEKLFLFFVDMVTYLLKLQVWLRVIVAIVSTLDILNQNNESIMGYFFNLTLFYLSFIFSYPQ